MPAYLYYRPERVGVAVRLQICMWEVLGSNYWQDTDCSDCLFVAFFSSSRKLVCGSSMKRWPSLSQTFPIHCSPLVLLLTPYRPRYGQRRRGNYRKHQPIFFCATIRRRMTLKSSTKQPLPPRPAHVSR